MDELREELIRGFILYQYRLDFPFPVVGETGLAEEQYRTNPIFRNKVLSLVAGVLNIVDKHCVPKRDG